MFLLDKLPSILESLHIQSGDGVIIKMLDLLQQSPTKGELTSYLEKIRYLPVKTVEYLKKIFVIVEFLLANKKTILKDKSILWLTNSQDVQLLKTLDLDLTLRGKDCYPFWNNVKKDLYNQLPLHPKIDCVDLDSSYLSGSLNKKMLNSWFYTKKMLLQNKNLLEISYPLCKFLTVDGMEKEDIKLSNLKCRKIKLKVPTIVKKLWNEWSNLYRFTYNRALWFQKESSTLLSKDELINCIKSDHNYPIYDFIKKLPTELREGASKEVSKNFKSCFSNLKNDNIKTFDIGYKSKKVKSWTMTNFQKRSLKYITKFQKQSVKKQEDKDLRNFRILPSYCPFVIHSYQKIPEEITNDFSIHFDGGDYYLILPYEENKVPPNIEIDNVVTSIDPGVRTFASTFNNKGECEELCTSKSSGYLHSIALQIDGYISKRSKGTRKKRKYLSKKIVKLRRKLKNLQKELHNKVANHLTKKSKIILIPSFKVKEMSSKFKRKIKTKTVRNMMLLGHTLFKQKLKTKAFERGSQLLGVEEHYTSKTCTQCGTINESLGSSKVFKCKSCLLTIDRDINAARNILLRAMRGSAISDNDIKETILFKSKLLNLLEKMETDNSLGKSHHNIVE